MVVTIMERYFMSEKEVRKFSIIDGVINGKYTFPQAVRFLKTLNSTTQKECFIK